MNRRNDRPLRVTRTMEKSGRTVEDAVRAALAELRASKDDVEIEVLDEGRGGFLGLGAREARVRIRVKGGAPPGGDAAREAGRGGRGGGRGQERGRHRDDERGAPSPRDGRDGQTSRPRGGSHGTGERREAPRDRGRGGQAEAPRPTQPRRQPNGQQTVNKQVASQAEARPAGGGARAGAPPRQEFSGEPRGSNAPNRPDSGRGVAGGREREVAACGQGILDRMGFAGTVTATFEDEAYQVTIEAREDDALIIGKGGETLDAIQHILLKAAGRREEGVQMKVDVSGYRHKREEDLASRVRAIAAEVLESGKSQLIGPLRAAERRTVHRAVASIEGVTTKALGEGLLKKILIHSEGVSDAADAEDATLEVTPLGPEFEMSRDVEPRGAGGRDGRRRSGERQGHRERRPESQHPRATPDVDSPTKRPPMVERPAEGGIAVDRIGSLAPKPLPETSVETTGPEPSEWGRRPRPAKGRRK